MRNDIQIWGLDYEYKIHSILKPSNTQWTRKYYEAGTFSLQLPIGQYSESIRYVYSPNRPELGVVSQRNFVIDSSGFEYVQISGFFLENELNDKISDTQFIGKGEVVAEITRYVTQFKKDIPLLEVATPTISGTPTDFESLGDEIGDKTALILKLHEMGYRVHYDYEKNKKIFSIYEGKDRTQSQFTNNFVTFSTSFGNLTRPNVLTDESDYKNYCLVKGEIDGNPIYVGADLSGGGYKQEIFLENAGVTYDAEKMTQDSYKELLRNAGIQELLDRHAIVNNVEFDTDQSSYEYMVDVDLGDKCDIIIAEMQLTLEARIIAIYEVVKAGKHKITFEFGNQKVVSRKGR